MKTLSIVFIAACLLFDTLPHHASPGFRYTGSNPARDVWNFGWPIVLFINDPTLGFKAGPLVWLMPAVQLVVYTVGVAFVVICRRLRYPTGERGEAKSHPS